MDPISTLQAEIIAIGIAFAGAFAAFGRWLIRFVQKSIEENANARKGLERELRLQIKKLEARNDELDERLQACEKRWDDWLASQAGK